MRISEILTLSRIRNPLAATSKRDAIDELIQLLAQQGDLSDPDRALQAVLDREMTRTTGIGHGLGIPHGKTGAVHDIVMAFAKAPEPIEFDSVDGKGVTLIVLLLSPVAKAGPHIQALARVSRLMSSELLRRKLNAAASSDEILNTIRRHESEFA
ncbi:MAG: PTS sugar transporter subunit IIA [Phycisphaerae bacterium]